MGALISYTLESGLILLACYLIYKWLLAGRNEPVFNRMVILSCYIISAILPALRHSLPKGVAAASGDVEFGKAEIYTVAGQYSSATTGIGMLDLLCLIYMLGVVVVAVMTIVSWRRISRLIASGERLALDGCDVSVVDDNRVAPMSRMKVAIINRTDFQSAVRAYILRHELAHISHRHGIDLMIARLFEILMWYNPAAWLMAAELRAVHEFQADSEVIASGADPRSYQLMLVKKVAGLSFQPLANNLNHSKLKKRITMMQKTKSGKGSRVLALAMAPALLVALSVTRIPAVAGSLSTLSKTMTELPSFGKSSEKISESAYSEQKTESATDEKREEKREVVNTPDRLPAYPGGEAGLLRDLMDNITFPENVTDDGAELHKVVVRFVVETDGSVSSPEIIRSQGEAYDTAAIEAVKKLKRFTPGMADGKEVAVSYVLPVNFKTKK